MSRSFNQVTLIGNLTRDPETRATQTGSEFCRFSLALNYSYSTADGESKEEVDFVDVIAWSGLASIVQTYCHKGKQIMVQGRLKSSTWEQDGQTRSKLQVVAKDILLLGSRNPDEGGSTPTAEPAKTKSKSSKPAPDEAPAEDYDMEEIGYNQEGMSPEDLPF